jgi:hypothetical protein
LMVGNAHPTSDSAFVRSNLMTKREEIIKDIGQKS